MKFKLLLAFSMCAFFFLSSNQMQAQKVFNDTIFVFNERLDIVFDNAKGFNIGMPPTLMKAMSPAPKQISLDMAKKMKLPRATKTFSGPIVVKQNGNCYKVGCAKECTDCKLAWYDRNGDRKIQPRKELRCICKTGKQCKIRVGKADCK